MLGVSTFLKLCFRVDVSNLGAIFAQDPPNKWLLEGIATGEQAAFETGRLEGLEVTCAIGITLINPSTWVGIGPHLNDSGNIKGGMSLSQYKRSLDPSTYEIYI